MIANSLISILIQVVKFDGTANVHNLLHVVATDEDYLATTGQAATFAAPAILSIYKRYDTGRRHRLHVQTVGGSTSGEDQRS